MLKPCDQPDEKSKSPLNILVDMFGLKREKVNVETTNGQETIVTPLQQEITNLETTNEQEIIAAPDSPSIPQLETADLETEQEITIVPIPALPSEEQPSNSVNRPVGQQSKESRQQLEIEIGRPKGNIKRPERFAPFFVKWN